MKTFVVGDIHGRRAQFAGLLKSLPRDAASDTLVFLGDLIDRGPDAPGVVSDVIELYNDDPERVVVIRGNHEQMMLDFIDEDSRLWLSPATGGEETFQQYTESPLQAETEEDFVNARRKIKESVPPEHLEFFRVRPLYHEDDYALYVHAGLDHGKHPRDTEAHHLLWTRDEEFYKKYRGKPCVFGHTPTTFLPLLGRLGRHGIYISHSAIGIDTGYNYNSPLTCLSLPDFTLYQSFADGHLATHHITAFIPEELQAMRKAAANV
ncbi:MAG: serine/threonine protein phosphatase 1 [Acidobacteriota bacterium]|jgi:serine/threonine protein phosphatase 1|nr:serine/threonine protein phosphatase 1 [Acidobacteriota bacterium]